MIKKAFTWMISPRVFASSRDTKRYGLIPTKLLSEAFNISKYTQSYLNQKKSLEEKVVQLYVRDDFSPDECFLAFLIGNEFTIEDLKRSYKQKMLQFLSVVLPLTICLPAINYFIGQHQLLQSFWISIPVTLITILAVFGWIYSAMIKLYQARLIWDGRLPAHQSFNSFIRSPSLWLLNFSLSNRSTGYKICLKAEAIVKDE